MCARTCVCVSIVRASKWWWEQTHTHTHAYASGMFTYVFFFFYFYNCSRFCFFLHANWGELFCIQNDDDISCTHAKASKQRYNYVQKIYFFYFFMLECAEKLKVCVQIWKIVFKWLQIDLFVFINFNLKLKIPIFNFDFILKLLLDPKVFFSFNRNI